MFKRFKNIVRNILWVRNLEKLAYKIDESKVLIANVLLAQRRSDVSVRDIRQMEFKVFSQFGEDGILQYLISRLSLPKDLTTFVEFGVETYEESNTRFLLINNNWRGLVIDGDNDIIKRLRKSQWFWRYDITARSAFLTTENINYVIGEAGFKGDIGVLSIDIDGNDYWIWEAIEVIRPIIVVCEYNSVFGARRAVTIPYRADFSRRLAHYSSLYFGCSLKALELLGERKGYALVGSNSAGCNAFFVRHDFLNGLPTVTTAEAYVESRFRESRDHAGRLNYLSGGIQLEEIANLQLVDLGNGGLVEVGSLSKLK